MSKYDAKTDVPLYNRKLDECLSKRTHAYQTELGNWQEQLDMIYNNMDDWRSKVLEIKNRYPKPTK